MLAIIIPYPGWGQLLAIYKFARYLQENKYQVLIAAAAEYQASIADNGFQGILYSVNAGSEGSGGAQSRLKRFYTYMKGRDRYFDGMVGKLMQAYQPVVVFVDSGLNRLVFPFIHRDAKVVLFSTSLSGDYEVNNPPYNSSIIPRFTLLHRLYIDVYWQWWFFRKWGFFLRSEIFSLGYFDYNLKRICRFYGMDDRIINRKRVWHGGFRNIPEILFYPKEFEFSMTKNKNRHYVGPMMDMERNEAGFDVDFDPEVITSPNPVICCSLGTHARTFDKDIDIFYKKVIEAVSQRPGYTLIMSIGKGSGISRTNLAPNIYLFDVIPQIEVLRKADLMINHGGIGSVKECILLEVPMISYPLDARIDQKGTAVRVEYFGMGLQGDHKRDSAADILKKIEYILGSDAIKENLSKWRGIFEASEKNSDILHIING